MNLENTECDLCGSSEFDLVAKTTDPERIVAGEFSVVRCRQCSLQYLNPRPDKGSISGCYPKEYYAHVGTQESIKTNSFRGNVRRAIRKSSLLSRLASYFPYLSQASRDLPLTNDFAEWLAPGKMLEVGCGAGGILNYMKSNGWQTFGIEPSMQAAGIAESKGHRIFRMGGDDAYPDALLEMQFDLIYLSHSIEHMHYPTKALLNLRSMLKPESGKLVLEVPNVDSVLTYLFGAENPIYDVPRHLYFFSPATLTKLLDKTGFAVESMRTISRPQQFIKAFNTKSDSFHLAEWKSEADKIKSDQDFQRIINALSVFSQNQDMGAALRVVAKAKKNS